MKQEYNKFVDNSVKLRWSKLWRQGIAKISIIKNPSRIKNVGWILGIIDIIYKAEGCQIKALFKLQLY